MKEESTGSRTVDVDDPRLDPATEIRDELALDRDALEAWLAEQVEGFASLETVRQFPSGHSNLTYALACLSRDGEPLELVLRRPPPGAEKIAKGHDMGREHTIVSGVGRVWDKVPATHGFCDDTDIIGAPFYVMDRLRGTVLRGRTPKGADGSALAGLTPEVMQECSAALVDTLVEIHGLDVDAAGLSEIGYPEGYAARQVHGWIKRYKRAQTDDIPSLDDVADWLEDHIPDSSDATLVHNDFKYDNVVLDPDDLGRVVGVLDWELATVGDPLMDLGTTLAYWFESDDPPALQAMPIGPTEMAGNLSRIEVAERYATATGRSIDNLLFYYVFALFKVAGIGQQIYFRFKQGDTADPRFAMIIVGVKALGKAAAAALESGRIDEIG